MAITWNSVKDAEYVYGDGMLRLKVVKETPYEIVCEYKEPTRHMMRIGCDRCTGPHRPKNEHCSASLQIASHMTDPLRLYDRVTGAPMPGYWEITDTAVYGKAGRVTLRRL